MEIKIDTERDSKETIKKVINLLENIVLEDTQEKSYNNDVLKNDLRDETKKEEYTAPNEGLFGIFDSNSEDKPPERIEEVEHEEKKEEKKENIDIIPY